jgi:hypothetical protein
MPGGFHYYVQWDERHYAENDETFPASMRSYDRSSHDLLIQFFLKNLPSYNYFVLE